LAFLSNLGLGSFLFLRGKRTAVSTVFALFVLSNAWAIFGDFFYYTDLVKFFSLATHIKFAYIGGVFSPALLFHFVIEFTQSRRGKKFILFPYCISGVFLFLELFSKDFFHSVILKNSKLIVTTGLFYNIFVIYTLGSLLFAIFFGVSKYFFAEAQLKKRLQYHLLGICVVLGAALAYFAVMEYGIPIRVDNLSLMLYSFIIAYAITKHELMDVKVVVAGGFAYLVTGAFIAISFLLIWLYSRDYLGWSIFSSLFFVLFWAYFGQPLHKFLITTAKRTFVKGYYDPEKVIEALSEELSKEEDKVSIFKVIMRKIDDALEFEKVSLWLGVKEGGKVDAYEVLDDGGKRLESRPLDDPIVVYFTKCHEIVNSLALPENLQAILQKSGSKNVWIIPLHSPEGLEALLILGERSGGSKLSSKDLGFLKTLLHITESTLYKLTPYEKIEDEFMNTRKKLHDAELQLIRSHHSESVLHAFKEFSHEMKTPFNIIQLSAQRVDDAVNEVLPASLEFVNHHLSDAGGQKVAEQLTALEAKFKEHLSRVEKQTARGLLVLNEIVLTDNQDRAAVVEKQAFSVVDAIQEALENMDDTNITVVKNFAETAQIEGQYHDLVMMFGNLFSNAAQAMPNGGTLTVETGMEHGQVAVTITDTGVGIPESMREQVWQPFVSGEISRAGSSKARTGWGLTIVNRIVTEHQGTVRLESELGKGTTILLRFPVS